MNTNAQFNRELLRHYSIIEQPGVYKVSIAGVSRPYVRSTGELRTVYLRVGTYESLLTAVQILDDRKSCLFHEVEECFFKGILWSDRLPNPEAIPIRGEEVLATFSIEDGALACTDIGILPRRRLALFDYTKHCVDIKEYVNLKQQY